MRGIPDLLVAPPRRTFLRSSPAPSSRAAIPEDHPRADQPNGTTPTMVSLAASLWDCELNRGPAGLVTDICHLLTHVLILTRGNLGSLNFVFGRRGSGLLRRVLPLEQVFRVTAARGQSATGLLWNNAPVMRKSTRHLGASAGQTASGASRVSISLPLSKTARLDFSDGPNSSASDRSAHRARRKVSRASRPEFAANRARAFPFRQAVECVFPAGLN